MRNKAFAVVIALMLTAPAAPVALAQDLDTSQLEQRADMERNRILVRSTMRQKERYDARRGRSNAQATACANRARFSREYGANHPKVRKLQSLCARAGY